LATLLDEMLVGEVTSSKFPIHTPGKKKILETPVSIIKTASCGPAVAPPTISCLNNKATASPHLK